MKTIADGLQHGQERPITLAALEAERQSWRAQQRRHTPTRDHHSVNGGTRAEEVPDELNQAREQAGLPLRRGRPQATGTIGGLRTVQAARVPLGRTIAASEVKRWR